MIDFTSIQQMLEDAKTGGLPLWQNIMVSDCARQGIDPKISWGQMERLLDAMEQADRDYRDTDRSVSGLVGGDGGKMARYGDGGDTLCGPFLSEVMAGALRMGECNACMKRIVAAPTAGSCGVLPAVLLPCGRRFGLPREQMIQALYISAGFGMVIANRASISGAEGGCQAEVGSAAAMAAAALVFLMGGTDEMMANACAMGVKNLLGLVCDPVGGLVEVPCVKRNGHVCPVCRPDGTGGEHQPGAAGPGAGRHAGGGGCPAPQPEGDGEGRPGRHPLWKTVRTGTVILFGETQPVIPRQ